MKALHRWFAAGLAATLLAAVGGLAGCRKSASKKGRSDTPMTPQPLHPLTPATVAGWQAADNGREFAGKGVFEALNGGAEIYLDYGFVRLLVREYRKARRPRLTLHFFEMRSAPDAYGMFTHEREGADVGVGEDSDYAGGLLRFWKGLIVSKDPVAADRVGLEILRAKRKEKFGRERPFATRTHHVELADTRHGVGVADLARIDLVKLGWKEGLLLGG